MSKVACFPDADLATSEGSTETKERGGSFLKNPARGTSSIRASSRVRAAGGSRMSFQIEIEQDPTIIPIRLLLVTVMCEAGSSISTRLRIAVGLSGERGMMQIDA